MKALLAFMPAAGESPISVGKVSFFTEDGQMLTYDFQGGAVMPNGAELHFKRVPNGITITASVGTLVNLRTAHGFTKTSTPTV